MEKKFSQLVCRGVNPASSIVSFLREFFRFRRDKLAEPLPEGTEVMTGNGTWPAGDCGVAHSSDGKKASITRSIFGVAYAEGGVAVAGGDYGAALSEGPHAVSVGTGEGCLVVASGYNALAVSSRPGMRCCTEHPGAGIPMYGVAAALGPQSCAKGEVGDWLILAERARSDPYGRQMWNGCYGIRRIRAVRVDGVRIRPDTWYELRGGRIRKVK